LKAIPKRRRGLEVLPSCVL